MSNILVIDDGSSDGTSMVATDASAEIIRHDRNRGKGAALKTGFDYAIANNFDSILTIDADGQHRPEYIPSFLAAYHGTRADLIIGSRHQNKLDMPWDRCFSNWATSTILTHLLGTKIYDSQCGYRLIARKTLETVSLNSNRYELETEIIIKAVQAGLKVHFIPIEVEYGDRFPTQIRKVADTLRWCRMVLESI